AAALTIVGTATAASAGEITGNGKLTPIKALQDEDHPAGPANSACAFSGYNDGYASGAEPYRTQSWGTDGPSKAGGQEVKFYATSGLIKAIGPGVACRGGVFHEE
ncbi:MAG: hypothetical protein OEV20_05510, partial [Actinomycetota bacterium]|nr:hypothetical protein [Actinomycetota bacterium]